MVGKGEGGGTFCTHVGSGWSRGMVSGSALAQRGIEPRPPLSEVVAPPWPVLSAWVGEQGRGVSRVESPALNRCFLEKRKVA